MTATVKYILWLQIIVGCIRSLCWMLWWTCVWKRCWWLEFAQLPSCAIIIGVVVKNLIWKVRGGKVKMSELKLKVRIFKTKTSTNNEEDFVNLQKNHGL